MNDKGASSFPVFHFFLVTDVPCIYRRSQKVPSSSLATIHSRPLSFPCLSCSRLIHERHAQIEREGSMIDPRELASDASRRRTRRRPTLLKPKTHPSEPLDVSHSGPDVLLPDRDLERRLVRELVARGEDTVGGQTEMVSGGRRRGESKGRLVVQRRVRGGVVEDVA